MARTYHRRARGAKTKYSVEQKGFTTTLATLSGNSRQAAIQIVPPTGTEGMRKVKHLTSSLSLMIDHQPSDQFGSAVYWALVYVPEGYNVNGLNIGAPSASSSSLYEPSQFVMNCGISDPTAGPIRVSTRLSRNLNQGDSIYLVVGTYVTNTAVTPTVQGVVRYAISLH